MSRKKKGKNPKASRPFARLSDDELRERLEKAYEEVDQTHRTGKDLVQLKDAILGMGKLVDDRRAALQKRQEALRAEITGVEEEMHILTSDSGALNAELDRLGKEVAQRFDGDWEVAEQDVRRQRSR